jgi:hypothetical protein
MKYSIKGRLFIDSAEEVVDVINNYKIWKFTYHTELSPVNLEYVTMFEIWLSSKEHEERLFEELKPLVISQGGHIDSHECFNEDSQGDNLRPCVINKIYRGE